MIDKGFRIKCDRCGHEEFKVVEFDDEIDVSVNLCGDIGGGWTGVRIPELTVLCPTCTVLLKQELAVFMYYNP